MAADLAAITVIEQAWRPLNPVEKNRAEYYLGVASRAIRRRWPDVDQRIANADDYLGAEDVADVVVQMVLSAVDVPPVRGAKSFTVTTGPMSRSATLEAGSTSPSVIEAWMVEVFEGRPTAMPLGSFPPSTVQKSLFYQAGGELI